MDITVGNEKRDKKFQISGIYCEVRFSLEPEIKVFSTSLMFN